MLLIGKATTAVARVPRIRIPTRRRPAAVAIQRRISRRSYQMTAPAVPTWSMASKTTPGCENPGITICANARCPDDDTGRNSVSPWRTPSSTATPRLIQLTREHSPEPTEDRREVPLRTCSFPVNSITPVEGSRLPETTNPSHKFPRKLASLLPRKFLRQS